MICHFVTYRRLLVIILFCDIGMGFVKGATIHRLRRSYPSNQGLVDFEENRLSRDKRDLELPVKTKKRAAMLLDRLMVALHHALEDEGDKPPKKIGESFRDPTYYATTRMGTGNSINNSNSKKPIASQLTASNEFSPKYDTSENDLYNVVKGDSASLADDINDFEAWPGNEVSPPAFNQPTQEDSMGLQRRGHDVGLGNNKGRVYWRCYFNAVTCF